jgi:2'-5' RNA ligase
MVRLAVAVWPPPEVVATLSALERPRVPGVTWSSPSQWMVKVRPLGHVDGDVIEPLREVLDRELGGAPPPACVLGPATRRLGGQWLGAPVAGLDELGAVVFEVTEDLVPVTHPQPFRADVVLARGRVPARLAGTPISARWTAREITLVADRSSPHGPLFEDLLTIPLAGSGPIPATRR